MTKKEMAQFLRCSIMVRDGTPCPEECPYRTLERVKDDYPIPPDFVINGVGYWESCDYETLTEDAARMLEE